MIAMYLEFRVLDDKRSEDAVREIRRIVSRGPGAPASGPGRPAPRRPRAVGR